MRLSKFTLVMTAALLVIAGLLGVLGYQLSRAPILQLLVQMNPQESSPVLAWASRTALYAFHPTEEEVNELNREAGARYAATFPDPEEAAKLLTHFVSRGVRIDSVDESTELRLTALHSAALNPNPAPVQLLLSLRADPDVRDGEGRSPLDLARTSQSNRPDLDYGEVIRLLEAASSDAPAQQPASAAR